MKKTFFSLLLFTVFFNTFAQHPSCDGNRYMNYAFAAIDSTIGVQFGHNFTLNNVSQNLLMDIYQPNADPAPKRPLIIYVHGGGFVQGTRQEGLGYCLVFAYKGFVTATIDYRLIDVPLASADSTTIATGLIQAISDAKAAIRFFVEDAATANIYKIDTNYIFIAGGSAGGIIASQVAYLDTTDNIPTYFSNLLATNGGFTGNSSTNTSYTTPIKGVVNYSGAMWRKEWMSVGEPPIFSAHDNFDTIVPCNYGLSKAFYPTYTFPFYLIGSCAMQQEANAKGIYNQIFINNSSGHGAYLQSSPLIDTVLQKTSDFLYNIICTNILSVNVIENSESLFQIYPNPATETLNIEMSIDAKIAKIKIYNALGQIVKSNSNINSRSISIETADLTSGLYLIVLQSGDREINGKFTINK